jgi:SAM-dependent methyltransferase
MSNTLKYNCLKCNGSSFAKSSTFWICETCSTQYSCSRGMPKLYIESQIGAKDKSLRDYFYNGLLGKFYQFLMPFLTLPARPFKISKRDWFIYGLSVLIFIILIINSVNFFIQLKYRISYIDLTSLIILVSVIRFFIKHPYFFYLLILAIPVKIAITNDKYQPTIGFKDIHKKLIDDLLEDGKELQVLDISTGTGNSLFRHGWMRLNAEYTGLDLSETMLAQCQDFMMNNKIPIDLVVGDATNLPFRDGFFDVVMNYGAINGYTDIKKALQEMKRVTKKGGLLIFLDEQLYDKASSIEKIYFRKVLSSHNIIHHCPIEFMPADMKKVEVYQIYEFYYLCTCRA